MGTPRQLAALSTQPTASDGEMDDAAGLVSQNEQTKSARNVAVGTTKNPSRPEHQLGSPGTRATTATADARGAAEAGRPCAARSRS